MWTRFGNPAPLALFKDENDVVTAEPVEGNRSVTYTLYPEDWSMSECFIDLTGNIWNSHFQPEAQPLWVASDNKLFAQLLADHFKCEIWSEKKALAWEAGEDV